MDIKIQEILDRGNDEERLVLRVLKNCNLNSYLVLDTTFDNAGNISNRNRHVYVFANVSVKKDDYVVLYTKVGNNVVQNNADGTTSYFFIGTCRVIFGIMSRILLIWFIMMNGIGL